MLLPYTLQNVYRKAAVRDLQRVSRFCQTCIARPDLGRLVRKLVFAFPEEPPSDICPPSREQLIGMCSTLVAVTEVRVLNSPLVSTLVLSRTVASRFLASMTVLGLENAFDDSPWSFSHYQHLALYPRLRHLILSSNADADAAISSIGDDEKWGINQNVFFLGLEGPISNSAATSLIVRFRVVGALELGDGQKESDLSAVLLQALSSLTFLRTGLLHPHPSMKSSIDDALGRFQSLRTLVLPVGASRTTSSPRTSTTPFPSTTSRSISVSNPLTSWPRAFRSSSRAGRPSRASRTSRSTSSRRARAPRSVTGPSILGRVARFSSVRTGSARGGPRRSRSRTPSSCSSSRRTQGSQ